MSRDEVERIALEVYGRLCTRPIDDRFRERLLRKVTDELGERVAALERSGERAARQMPTEVPDGFAAVLPVPERIGLKPSPRREWVGEGAWSRRLSLIEHAR
jgi:hypothetical protein